uniref:Uncharacterized protein n=1 Tax=Arundo donax TaxID=35708 RepID=A0A0A9C5S8_ARUDO
MLNHSSMEKKNSLPNTTVRPNEFMFLLYLEEGIEKGAKHTV